MRIPERLQRGIEWPPGASANDRSWPIVLIRRHVTLELEADLGAVSDIDATTGCR